MSAPTDADLRALCEEVRRLDGLVPGDWVAFLCNYSHGPNWAVDTRCESVADRYCIADLSDCPRERQEACARLIAAYRTAAPRLAVACEGLLGRVAEAEAALWGLLCALGNHERAALDLMSMKWFAEAERDKALRRTREAEADADRYGERAEKAEAEAARLRQEADEARESMEYAYEKKRALDAEVERLRAVIETAPHGPWCDGELRLTGRCDCWKSRALVPAGAERSEGK